jgi:putative copper resistance protein D
MIQLAGYFSVLLHAIALAGMAASLGGLVFCGLVLRPLAGDDNDWTRAVLRLAKRGVWTTVACLLAILLLAPWGLAEDDSSWPFLEYLDTGFARLSCLRLVLGVVFAIGVMRLAAQPAARVRWRWAGLSGAMFALSGAGLVHAVSRLSEVVPLMFATLLHQFAAIIWIGSVFALTVCAAQGRAGNPLWPQLLARFSPLGMACVASLFAAGLFVASRYVGDWASLIGTNYGIMVIAKLLLLSVALTLAALNFIHTRQWQRSGEGSVLTRTLPVYIEAELVALVAVMLLGASLAATPPATDLTGERATLGEVIETLAPKMPRLLPPTREALMADHASSLDFFNPATEMDKAQSNFNHNVSGVLLLLIGLVAIIDRLQLARWARHWPLLFLPFALLLQVIVEPTGWPLGDEGFFEPLLNPSVVQHRLASLLPLFIGVMEWRVQTGALANTVWRYTFPGLCFLGGAVLLTHTHVATGLKSEFLIEVSHAGIALFAVLAGIGRWLELRLPPPAPRLTGVLWTSSLLAIGFLLLFYHET